FEGVGGAGAVEGGAVEAADQIHAGGAGGGECGGAGEVSDGLGAAAEEGALEGGGEGTGAGAIEAGGGERAGIEDDETGQLLVLGAEAVGDPGAHAGAALLAVAGVEKVVGVGVLGEVGGDGTDDGEVVDALGDVREEIADGDAALAVVAEAPRA